jgi:hypothetical protein
LYCVLYLLLHVENFEKLGRRKGKLARNDSCKTDKNMKNV